MPDRIVYHCSSDPDGNGFVECSLVRWVRRDIKWRPDREEPVETLARRRFAERDVWHRAQYEAVLSRAAEEARAGRYGCTVTAIPLSDGRVELEVVEQIVDGVEFRKDVLLSRTIDATGENAVVEGSEVLSELRAWAEERNEERQTRVMQAESDETLPDLEAQDADRRAAAARELAAILERRD